MIKIKETTESTAEEVFVKELTDDDIDLLLPEIDEDLARGMLKVITLRYNEFLEKKSKEMSICLTCGRRFKQTEKKGTKE